MSTQPTKSTARVVAIGNRAFAPQYPLWSDGAGKRRWVRLPEGSTIDVSNTDRWNFPVGTRFWKEFTFDGHKVEARFLWKTGEGRWVFASYAWNADQTGATLVPESGLPDAAPIAPGKQHSIPSVTECDRAAVDLLTSWVRSSPEAWSRVAAACAATS